MRRPFGSSRDDEDDNQINLTPMLDVVFIMLIFFIVTATFVKEVGLDVNQPDDDKPKTVDPDKKSIVVRISSRAPNCFSNSESLRLSVASGTFRARAAPDRLPVSVTDTSIDMASRRSIDHPSVFR